MAVKRKRSFSSLTKPRPVTAWSYSRYGDYEKCPRFFKYKHVDRLPQDTESEAMRRGSALHKFVELYVLGQKATYEGFKNDRGQPICSPQEYKKFYKEWQGILAEFQEDLDALKEMNPSTEQQIIFTKDWEKETVWNDWEGAWVRIKVDALVSPDPDTLGLIDFKTGKIRDEHRGQLSLYAIAGFLIRPQVKTVRGELWYFDQAEVVDEEYERKHLTALQKDWAKKTKAMLSDTIYKPKPSHACTWCPFSKAKGGPCEF